MAYLTMEEAHYLSLGAKLRVIDRGMVSYGKIAIFTGFWHRNNTCITVEIDGRSTYLYPHRFEVIDLDWWDIWRGD